MPKTTLFPAAFTAPVADSLVSVGAGLAVATPRGFQLVDDGTIPATAVISTIRMSLVSGSFTPGVVPVGIQPYLLSGVAQWAGPTYSAPPSIGTVYGSNDYVLADVTGTLFINPITLTTWTRADLFADSWGWWAVWNNVASTIALSAQTNKVVHLFVEVEYAIPTTPTPTIGAIRLATLTVEPETYTFQIEGTNYDQGLAVLITPPAGPPFLVSGAGIIAVMPLAAEFLVTRDQIGLAGVYTIQARSGLGVLSTPFSFTLAGPGVIVVVPPGGIHRFAYAWNVPFIGTAAPLSRAPGSTIDVYESGTLTHATVYEDALLTLPVPNPIVADANGWYGYYLAPEVVAGQDHRVDEYISGTGIDAPYTIGDAIPYDPRIIPLETALATLTASLASSVSSVNTGITAVQTVPIAFPLGGSLTEGIQSGVIVDVVDAVTLQLNAALLGPYIASVIVTLRTEDPATSVQAFLVNITDSLVVGTSAVSVSTTGETVTFSATLTAGIKQYRLQILPVGTNYVFANGYLQLAHP